ncbi:MAG: M64 family metallopeptidase [Phycisphaerales bacterium]
MMINEHSRHRRRRALPLAAGSVVLSTAFFTPQTTWAQDATSSAEEREPYLDTVYYDEADETGQLTGGVTRLLIDAPDRKTITPIPAEAYTLGELDNPANRIDLVFVGDGYLASQMSTYHAHVDLQVGQFFAEEPFITYAPFFNVHRVEVVSAESGVDHDPTYPIWRNTALDMGFWCSGIERLLCVNVGAAYGYAANAPDVDLVAAIANSVKYGGAGYSSSDLATASGGNSLATEVLLHEFGHALGNLADEYHYYDGTRYNGGEVPEANVSIYDESQIRSRRTKWHLWLGENDPNFDGLVSAFEGARYYQYGIYRPTNNSLMNSLNRPFNLPSVEAIIIEMYRIVDPIDDASPTAPVYTEDDTLFVDPIDPSDHALTIQWYLDGDPIPWATNERLDLGLLQMSPGRHEVSVTVVDEIEWVRDEDDRADWLTETREYQVDASGGGPCLALSVPTLTAGEDATIEVTGGVAGSEVAILWGVQDGQFSAEQNGWCVEFDFAVPDGRAAARVVAMGAFDSSGRFEATVTVPPSAAGRELRFQSAMRGTCPGTCMSEVVIQVVQ